MVSTLYFGVISQSLILGFTCFHRYCWVIEKNQLTFISLIRIILPSYGVDVIWPGYFAVELRSKVIIYTENISVKPIYTQI